MKNEPKLVWMPLRSLKRAARNPKKHSTSDLIASVKRFGFVEPIILNEATGKLASGHGRLGSLEKMRDDGEDPPTNIRVKGDDWLVPVLRGVSFANDSEADAYLLAANRLVETGGWDDDLLGDLLRSLVSQDVELLGTGFRDTDLRSFVVKGPPDEFEKFDETIETKHSCPKCGYEWS